MDSMLIKQAPIKGYEFDENGNIIMELLLNPGQNVPANVSITPKPTNIKFGKIDVITKEWKIDINAYRANKMRELGEACNKTILGRFSAELNGKVYEFSCDLEAQSNFEKADRAFEKGRTTLESWTAYENEKVVRVDLDQTSFEIVYLAHLNHIKNNVSKLRDNLMVKVNTAETPEEIEAINW